MIDRSRLTKDERDELTRALRDRRAILVGRDTLGVDEQTRKDARWRMFVVNTLLGDLD